jgi:hypothetical protein
VILLGGWVLLFNPQEETSYVPLPGWKRVRDYETAWLCEEGRRKEAADLMEKEAKKQGHRVPTPVEADLRYRCERSELVRR